MIDCVILADSDGPIPAREVLILHGHTGGDTAPTVSIEACEFDEDTESGSFSRLATFNVDVDDLYAALALVLGAHQTTPGGPVAVPRAEGAAEPQSEGSADRTAVGTPSPGVPVDDALIYGSRATVLAQMLELLGTPTRAAEDVTRRHPDAGTEHGKVVCSGCNAAIGDSDGSGAGAARLLRVHQWRALLLSGGDALMTRSRATEAAGES